MMWFVREEFSSGSTHFESFKASLRFSLSRFGDLGPAPFSIQLHPANGGASLPHQPLRCSPFDALNQVLLDGRYPQEAYPPS
ncbi:hypothetical protein TNCV_3018491 [Trichonephila clavipes]|nr:hypothetical protein TNCV_3018491 [Trichonephila clavipes]